MRTRKKPQADSSLVIESFATGADGTRLYVRQRHGPSQTTALLCDGLVCDGFIYKYLWEDLSQSLSVAHSHYRGHGRSAAPVDRERISVPDLASDLDAVRRHIGDPPVVLVGHSLGTQVALEAYRLRPAGVRALILLCGSFGRVTYTFKGTELLANVLPDLISFATRHPRIARGLWSRVPARLAVRVANLIGDIDVRTVRVEDVEPYFQHVAHVDFELFLRMLELAGQHSAEDILAEVQVPTLVVAGERDSFTPPGISEAMVHAIRGAELELIPGGTHIAPLEHRERVAARIESFLHTHMIVSP